MAEAPDGAVASTVARPTDVRPRIERAVRVTYAANHPDLPGRNVCVPADDREYALVIRGEHLANGATSATIMRRFWTPTPWEPDSDTGPAGG